MSVDFFLRLFSSRTHSNNTRAIHLIGIKCPSIQKIVESFFTAHKHIFVVLKDVVNRLSIFNKRRNNLVDTFEFFWRNSKASSAIREFCFIFFFCAIRLVLQFSQGAFLTVFAPITDIWRIRKFFTFFFLEVVAMLKAVLTVPTLPSPVNTSSANKSFIAVVAMDAWIKSSPIGTSFNADAVCSDFTGNSAGRFFEF